MNYTVKAIRGATTVGVDDPDQIRERTCELFDLLLNKNNITKDSIISIYLSLTHDLTSYNPATALRLNYGFDDVAMICGQEAHIQGSLKYCIRAMIHVSFPVEKPIDCIYLHDAQKLRANWVNK